MTLIQNASRVISMHARLLSLITVLTFASQFAVAQGTSAFTYQGELEQSGAPATGEYDFEFALFDDSLGGNRIAGPLAVEDLFVDGGLFSTEIDFGSGAFDGDDAWLEIRVRAGSSTDAYTVMTPRQKVTPAPLALHARTVAGGSIDTDQIAPGAVTDTEVDSSRIQLRIGAGCSAGSSIRLIDADGTVVCEIDDDSGGDITGVSAGAGLQGGGASGSVALAIGGDAVNQSMLAPGAVTLPAVGTRPSTGVHQTGQFLSGSIQNRLKFDNEDWDTGSMHGADTLDAYIFPDEPGLYLVTAALAYESGVDLRREARMEYLDASQSSSEILASHHGSERNMTLSAVYPFQGDGDRVFITVNTQVDSSMNSFIPSRFTATWLAPLP